MIINQNGRYTYPRGYPQQRPQQPQAPQAPQIPPNLLAGGSTGLTAGGATTNPTALKPPTAGLQPQMPPRNMQTFLSQPAQAPMGQMQQPQQPRPMANGGQMGFFGAPNSGGGGPINLTPGATPAQGMGLGNPFLFNPASPTGAGSPISTGGGTIANSGGVIRGGIAQGQAGPRNGSVISMQQGQGNIAAQLQAARDAANAKNEQRYGQQLDLNQSGLQSQLGEQNNSYGALSQMPGRSAQQQQQMLQQARQDQLGAINSSQQKLDAQASQAGNSQATAAKGAYGDLLKNADTRAGKTQNFVDSAYGNLSHTAQQGGAQSMGFLNQQNAGMQGLLNSYSNADYARENRQTKEQLAQIALDMADRGLSSDTLDQSLKRGVYDDSALRQAEIGDRRLGRSLDVANSYTGRGLGVLGDTNQQQFAAGSAYANAGLNARQNADSQALNIAGRGVDTSLDAQRSADAARLGIGQSFANQDINARGDLNRTGLNVAADQGAREQALAGQYAGQRDQTLANSNNQRIGIIGARTDQGPSEGDYFGLLAQAGASGRGGGGGGGGTIYNPQGGGHIAGGGGGDQGFIGGQYQGGGFGGGFGGGSSLGDNSSIGSQGYPGGFGRQPQQQGPIVPYSDQNSVYGMPQGSPNDPLSEGPNNSPGNPWAQNPDWWNYAYGF